MRTDQARQTAQQLLALQLPRRWRHVQAVAAKAEAIKFVAAEDAELLVSSAWLHDIGYSPALVDTGFHSLDGARWLLRRGCSFRLAALVANHSCASYEAAERGLYDDLVSAFPLEQSAASDALWYADMTTGPDGQNLTVEERLAEIRQRYGPDDVVTRFWLRAEPVLLEVVRRTQARIAAQPM
ncbi:phosphohydrolase [Micromonospora sp. MP36]|nr:phosphohydrolase [Micromonospora sp. MP36]